jgi:mono/diheme cytochrome c family protein
MRITYFSQTALTGIITLLLLAHGSAHGGTAATDYLKYCSVCHGDSGNGKSHAAQGLQPPPRDFTSSEMAQVLTREYIISVVTNGKPGTAMSPWNSRLSGDRIAALADYIRSKFMHAESTATSAAKPVTIVAGGKSIYDSTCSVCHGDDGAGAVWGRTSLNPAPVNFTRADPVNQLTRERMLASVTHGRAGTAMTAFSSQLTQSQIAAVVDYIRTTFMQADTQETTPILPPAASAASTVGMAVLHGMPSERFAPAAESGDAGHNSGLPRGLTGDHARGMALYLGNCTDCHGHAGNGDGPRAYFIFPRPRNFLLADTQARLNRAVLFNAISKGVPGREMPAWSKVMTDQQIADITEYVFQSFISRERPADAQPLGNN